MSIKITKEEKFVDGVSGGIKYLIEIELRPYNEYASLDITEPEARELLKALQEKLK